MKITHEYVVSVDGKGYQALAALLGYGRIDRLHDYEFNELNREVEQYAEEYSLNALQDEMSGRKNNSLIVPDVKHRDLDDEGWEDWDDYKERMVLS